MPKISVIVPVYNVANYIERCTTSLFEQTQHDIEYLFVDDCTPDNSIEVLHSVIARYRLRLAEENKEVRIMRMPANCGLTAVRRHGIIHAKGDYVIHCDSDDWVDLDYYEKLYQEAIRTDADVVVGGIRDEYKDHGVTRSMEVLPSTCREVVKNWYCKSVGMFTWNKLVRRSIYADNDLQPFTGVNMWEDNGLMLRVFYYAKGLSQIEGSVYHYNQANMNAMTSGYGRKEIDQMIRCASLLEEFFSKKPDYDEFKKTVYALQLLAKLNLVTTRFDWLKEFYNIFHKSEQIIPFIELDAFSVKGKVRFLFVKYHLGWFFVLLFKVVNGVKRYITKVIHFLY